MNFYERFILPHLVHLTCTTANITDQRRKLVTLAEGDVLEIGMGSGLNLPFYPRAKVGSIWGIEPSEVLRQKAKKKALQFGVDFNFIARSGEDIPLDSQSADTIVVTYTLCTIPDVNIALQEMNRVLKPGGRLLFSEHGKSLDKRMGKWQTRLNPFWKKISGGCHLNRDIPGLLNNSGFTIQTLETGYMSRLKPFSFNYRGTAVKGAD